ncbi:hypothetical protein J2X97_000877 [Epilithonimonas hungarica]|nr:hypothetical protein [Epilithonimonas hungarica]
MRVLVTIFLLFIYIVIEYQLFVLNFTQMTNISFL